MFYNKPPYRRGFHPAKILFFLIAAVGFAALLGAIVMFLWNAILPGVVGVKSLTFWEALGLLVLCRILFGSFRFGHSGRKHWREKRRRWRDKWMNMSDEERASMKERWKARCEKRNLTKEQD